MILGRYLWIMILAFALQLASNIYGVQGHGFVSTFYY